jgi:hypothetical protein
MREVTAGALLGSFRGKEECKRCKGCTGHQGVVILRPLAGRFLKVPLGKQKTGHHPEDTKGQ